MLHLMHSNAQTTKGGKRMRKLYEKPEAELIEFELKDAIADEEGGNIGNVSGSEGFEPWP